MEKPSEDGTIAQQNANKQWLLKQQTTLAALPPFSLQAELGFLFTIKAFVEHSYKWTGKRPDLKYFALTSVASNR